MVSGVPDTFIGESMLEALGKNSFSVLYETGSKHTYLWLEDGKESLAKLLEASVPGFKTEGTNIAVAIKGKTIKAMSFYTNADAEKDILHDLFSLNNAPGFVSIAFISTSGNEVERAKRYAESLLSSKDMKETKSTSQGVRGVFGPSSVHRDIYRDTEELTMAKEIVGSINDALLKNNLLYKVFLLYDSKQEDLDTYLKGRISELSETTLLAEDFASLIAKVSKIRAFPLGTSYCSKLVRIYGARLSRTIKAGSPPAASKGIPIGKVMLDGVSESTSDVCIDLPSFNLGFLVTGLPGSGKTMEAMHMVDRIIRTSSCPSFVLAPSEEWNGFAINHGMNLARLFADSLQINFFRCPPMAEKKKFCQDLAILLSSAAGAGPYRRPMEKCMLNAFMRAYQKTTNPDPVDVYHEIEESIIYLHGKRTNVGVKYTKHGENIKAALENLRIILNDPKYSTNNGMTFEELLIGGAVFDMSAASIATRSFLYALILNQLYALTSGFDTLGDEELRMLICVEEAQIIFKDDVSPAVEDLRQRIQDFRKRGIGLMLTAHNVNDVDLGIRRLCQTRLYMKQSPDSAYLAAKELIFPNVDLDKVVEKLKLLDSRVGALSFITRKDREKIQEESVLVKTEAFESVAADLDKKGSKDQDKNTLLAELETTFGDGFDRSKVEIAIKYLGENLYKFVVSEKHKVELVKNRKYLFCLINEKGKVTSETTISGKENLNIFIDRNKIIEII